ncbi:MAG: hypothetical protein HY695_16725 [Deltaproteobacteria bacterium]|nr:hypothetical protein [Deltaproteobacteria bacterium]
MSCTRKKEFLGSDRPPSCGADLPTSDGTAWKEVNPSWTTFLCKRITTVKLSGWQRLWVLVSVLWFVVVAFSTYHLLPNSAPPDPALEELLKKHVSKLTERLGHPPSALDLLTDDSPEARAYDERLERDLREARLKGVTNAFLIWAVPCAVLYALGCAIGWVRRGFEMG